MNIPLPCAIIFAEKKGDGESVHNLAGEIREHVKKYHGSCDIFPAPSAVFLNENDTNYAEPDISLICDRN